MVVAAEVPPIDEVAHVLDPEPPVTEPAAAETPPPSVREVDAEDAAMRAVEGGWTPRRAPGPAARPVEPPEPIADLSPATRPEPVAEEPAGASPAEIAGALSAARSAVAAASAAAEAALAEYTSPPDAAVGAIVAPVEATDHKPGSHSQFGKPAGLPSPRGGRQDDLRQIKGLSPQVESALNGLGIFHFDQIAAWDKKAIVWIDNHLALKGRLVREKWLEQARELARTRGRAARH
jgi:NADH-quinone oxidoreductase subunit E